MNKEDTFDYSTLGKEIREVFVSIWFLIKALAAAGISVYGIIYFFSINMVLGGVALFVLPFLLFSMVTSNDQSSAK